MGYFKKSDLSFHCSFGQMTDHIFTPEAAPTELSNELLGCLRDVPDFPKPGIIFKDITPLLAAPETLQKVTTEFVRQLQPQKLDLIAGIEARGLIFGALIAQQLGLPFVPLRKPGKLPWLTRQIEYELEYGSATLEIHTDALQPGQRVALVDDLLATGGTAAAAAQLIQELGGELVSFCFVLELGFLAGRERLTAAAPILTIGQL